MTQPTITGKSRIGRSAGAGGGRSFAAFDPARGEELRERFFDASPEEIDRAMQLASRSRRGYRSLPPAARAGFLEAIAAGMEEHAALIVGRAVRESGLGETRLSGELKRSTGQLRMFSRLVTEGSWVDAVIDVGDRTRKPAPKPDLRRMRIALGPVVVFAASNFPLAFSVAGGDTASALAGGNPVVVKAHPSHPGTSELVAEVILAAAEERGIPEGVFSLLHGSSFEVGNRLVDHDLTAAVAFTGSFQGGSALFRRSMARRLPIPVFAEMGSTNPLFVLPEIMRSDAPRLARLLVDSVTLGAGQFCTKPGIIVVREGAGLAELKHAMAGALAEKSPQTLLNTRIAARFIESRDQIRGLPEIEPLYPSEPRQPVSRVSLSRNAAGTSTGAVGAERPLAPIPFLGVIDAARFLEQNALHEEVFGPFALLVVCDSPGAMGRVAESMDGQLTMTVHGTEEELARSGDLLDLLVERTGRLIFGGVPTGVEVCAAMQHGGPYPATTDARFTSVGTAAIHRFTRPVVFQDWAPDLLPDELSDANPRKIWRVVDDEWTREAVSRKER